MLAQLRSGPKDARNQTFIAQPKAMPQANPTTARPTRRRQADRSSAPVSPAALQSAICGGVHGP